MPPTKINFSDKFSKMPPGDYCLRVIAKMNDYEFKIVKFKGDFVRPSHPDTDETFIILDGKMIIHFDNSPVELTAGEMIVIPKAVEHKPSSEEGYQALLIEPEDAPNTGGVESGMAIDKVEWV